MAKAEKIYDIAEKLGYEGGTGGNTSDAINACADALGFVGPHARRITDALSDLYTVVSGGGGGGGGGVTLGELVEHYFVNTTPSVGNPLPPEPYSSTALYIGDALACDSSESILRVAGGAKGAHYTGAEVTVAAYAVTASGDGEYATVRALSDVSCGCSQLDPTGEGADWWAWCVIPDAAVFEQDEFLIIAAVS